jgi:hypothetical protein
MNTRKKLLMIGGFFFCYLIGPACAQTTILPMGKELSIPRTILGAAQPAPTAPALAPTIHIDVKKKARPRAAPAQPAEKYSSFKRTYNKPVVNDSELVRAEWTAAFGCDVWYPYYVAKDIERQISNRVSIKLFKMKGKPKFDKRAVYYIFKMAF